MLDFSTTPPRMRITQAMWDRTPPEKRIEMDGRWFSYLTRVESSSPRDGAALRHTSHDPEPTVVRGADGVRRLIGRRRGWVSGRVIFCPLGHRVRTRILLGPGATVAVECGVKATRPDEPCAIWLYLLPDGHGGTEALEVHVDEVSEIERRQSDGALLTGRTIRDFLCGA
jgi:hypothetical protein